MKKLTGTIIRFTSVTILLSAIILFSNSCSKSSDNNMSGMTGYTGNTGGTGTPGANQVFIQGMAFSPSSITVSQNTSVTWTNKDAIAHTVTSDGGLFDSGNLATDGTYTYTFTTAGTFSYHCKIHPTMTGTVTVAMPVPTTGY